MIQLRRHPLIALSVCVVGLAIAITGGYIEFTNIGTETENVILVAAGLLHIFLGALMIVNPAIEIDNKTLRLKNLFGMERVSYPHDGLEKVDVVQDVLYIVHNGKRAAITRIQKKWLHNGDWKVMEEMFLKARELAKKAKKRSNPPPHPENN